MLIISLMFSPNGLLKPMSFRCYFWMCKVTYFPAQPAGNAETRSPAKRLKQDLFIICNISTSVDIFGFHLDAKVI